MYLDKRPSHRLPVYFTTLNHPAEYSCQHTYKKLALPHRLFKMLVLYKTIYYPLSNLYRDTQPGQFFMPSLGFANDLWRWYFQLDDKVICKGALFITLFSLFSVSPDKFRPFRSHLIYRISLMLDHLLPSTWILT